MSDISQRMLIFEDLSVEGFENADKTIGFNINYMKLILSSMAKWHAATSILLLKVIQQTKHYTRINEMFEIYCLLFY